MESVFPQRFAALEIYSDWAFKTEDERIAKRMCCSKSELTEFYDAVLPHLEPALEHLDTFPCGELPAPEQRLLLLTMMMAHVGLSVEIYNGSNFVPYAFEESRGRRAEGSLMPDAAILPPRIVH